jgi:hypothetical protein
MPVPVCFSSVCCAWDTIAQTTEDDALYAVRLCRLDPVFFATMHGRVSSLQAMLHGWGRHGLFVSGVFASDEVQSLYMRVGWFYNCVRHLLLAYEAHRAGYAVRAIKHLVCVTTPFTATPFDVDRLYVLLKRWMALFSPDSV